jgi:hypothetical protein
MLPDEIPLKITKKGVYVFIAIWAFIAGIFYLGMFLDRFVIPFL